MCVRTKCHKLAESLPLLSVCLMFLARDFRRPSVVQKISLIISIRDKFFNPPGA